MSSMKRSLSVPAVLLTAVGLASFAAAQESKPDAPASASAADQAVTIKPMFTKGQTMKYRWQIERTNGMGSMQQTASDTTKIDARLTVVVAEATESGYALDVTIDSVSAEHEMLGRKQAYDSAKPEDDKDRENEAFLAFKPLVGMKLTLNTDAAGVIKSVSGEPAVPQGRRVAEIARQFFIVPDYLMFRWNSILNAKRDGAPVKPGESWKHTDVFVATQVGRFEHVLTSTLKSVKEGVATIDSIGEMKLFPAKEGAPVAFDLKDTNILATSTWDLKDGLSKSLEMNRAFTLDGSAQGMPVKWQVDEKLTVTREQ